MQPATLAQPFFFRLANTVWGFSQRHWRLVVIAMLGLLHIAVFRGVADPWARSLLLAHLGLLLLWQPFLRAEQRVSPAQGLILSLIAMALLMYLNWWLLAFWVVVIAGLVGGKVYQQGARWQRRVYLVVLAYLLALLAVAVLPEIAPRREIAPEIRAIAEYSLPLAFVLIALFPAEPESSEGAQAIDFFYSVFLMLVLVVVILGSFTFMTISGSTYLGSLMATVFLVAGTMLLVGLAWNPRGGGGLGMFFTRYLFSIGLPVERWLRVLAELSQLEARPERFLSEAVVALARLPAVSGVAWRSGEARGERGAATPDAVEFANSEIALTIYSRYRLGPALQWHLHLLGQLLGEFYVAKLRETELREASYLQAVHETGARTTHDIKNLLQSLNVLCSVAAGDDYQDSAQLAALVRRQLPMVAQRLAETLEQLQHPGPARESYVPARAWWEALVRQYRDGTVRFESGEPPAEALVPRGLFDSVAGNLIGNALAKRGAEVRVALDCGERITLRVRDAGPVIPQEVAANLFRAPVTSSGGLGIGLFQAARQAEAAGYRLTLESNREGEVCFALSGSQGGGSQGSVPAESMRP